MDWTKSNREADAWIAKNVMGLDVVGEAYCWNPGGQGWDVHSRVSDGPEEYGILRPVYVKYCACDLCKDDDLASEFYPSLGHYWSCLSVVPWYTEHIVAAWSVVEHEVENGACPALLYDDNGHWALSQCGAQTLSIGDDPQDIATTFIVEAEMWSDTPALAICKALWLDAQQ